MDGWAGQPRSVLSVGPAVRSPSEPLLEQLLPCSLATSGRAELSWQAGLSGDGSERGHPSVDLCCWGGRDDLEDWWGGLCCNVCSAGILGVPSLIVLFIF